MSAPTANKTEAHRRRKEHDARDRIQRGAQYNVVIEQEPCDSNSGNAKTTIEQVTTFVIPANFSLHQGQSVRVKIVDVGDSHALALALLD
jgi:predicted RNA-binding protein with TRAM domain